MEYMECEPVQGVGYCSDNDCPCTVTEIQPGTGYLYISPEVVEFRRDALSLAEARKKLAPAVESGEYVSTSKYEPILICKRGATLRNLDLEVAAEDARLWWKSHKAPLRPTPCISEDAFSESVLSEVRRPDTEKESDSSSENEGLAALVDERIRNQSDDLSNDDVVSQFAGTPLAEMAEKMAQQESSDDDYATTDTAIPAQDLRRGDTLDITPPPSPEQRKKKRKPKNIMLILVSLVLFFAFITVTAVFLYQFNFLGNRTSAPAKRKTFSVVPKRKTQKKAIARKELDDKDEEFMEPPPVIEEEEEAVKEPAPTEEKKEEVVAEKREEKPRGTLLTRDFFASGYAFKDNQYYGNILFRDVTGEKGRYSQEVHVKGKDKVYHISGTFSYTGEQIVFSPQGADVDVVWRVKSVNAQAKSAVFYDPKKAGQEEAQIFLAACQTNDCR